MLRQQQLLGVATATPYSGYSVLTQHSKSSKSQLFLLVKAYTRSLLFQDFHCNAT
jgi:hypothetical protein